MSIDYDTDDDGDWYDADADDPGCTWCGGDGVGNGCDNPLECCGIDYCHACAGSGLRANQRVF